MALSEWCKMREKTDSVRTISLLTWILFVWIHACFCVASKSPAMHKSLQIPKSRGRLAFCSSRAQNAHG